MVRIANPAYRMTRSCMGYALRGILRGEYRDGLAVR
jgi:hypothetical protein